MGIGELIKDATERAKAKRAAKVAKKAKRTEVRDKKKSAKKDRKAAVKKVRSENKPGKERRMLVGAARAFHGTDKEGNKGGFSAFGKFAGKKTAQVKKRAERKAKRDERRAARKAK